MRWCNRLYFGTWQFGGQFKNLSSGEIEKLLLFALDSGVRRFDTAAVYGGGKVEEILGACLPQDAIIVTKIPAITKPILDSPEPIQHFYSQDSIYRSVYESLRRLRRDSVDTVLLHNWLPTWSSEGVEVLQSLTTLKNEGIAMRVGISLPDNFSTCINETCLSYIDVVEAPFNPQEQWILGQLPHLLREEKEILLRSLFLQGKLLGQYAVEVLLREAVALDTSVVIGMTTQEQIVYNIKYLKGV